MQIIKSILALRRSSSRQHGQTVLILAILIFLGTATAIFSIASSNKASMEADRKTAEAMTRAKDALIGYAATHSSRPGTLPCPDINNDGQTDTPCSTNTTRIGRLPWKSLGLPDLRDGAGERLWYAVSNTFKNSPVTGILNSDALGELTVDGTTGVIAVIFSPGPVNSTQQRDSANANNVAHYLDGGNEVGTMVFTGRGTTNDRLLTITKETLFPPVEQRVIREVGKNLQLHYSNPNASPGDNTDHRYYPYPAPFGSTSCDASTSIYRGRIALNCPAPLSVLTLPPWFSSNSWNEVIVYAVAPQCTAKVIPGTTTHDTSSPQLAFPTPDPGKYCVPTLDLSPFGILYTCYPYITSESTIDPTSLNCGNTGPTLTVDGNSAHALLFSSGPGLTGQNRPCQTVAACLEDSINTDGPSSYPNNASIDGADNFEYTKPKRTNNNNDNVFIVEPSP